jgi:hypothetical protein
MAVSRSGFGQSFGTERRREMVRVLFGLVLLGSYGVVQAAPLVYFSLEGRKQGTMDPFASHVDVTRGDVIEYRLRGRMAPEGTANENLRSPRIRPYKRGINSLSISIVQDQMSGIQVDLATPVQFAPDSSLGAGDGWGAHWTARPGKPISRTGSRLHDLLDIRPMHEPGVFTVSGEETIFAGSFEVASVVGGTGLVEAKWGPVAGGGKFDSANFFISPPFYDNFYNVWRSGSEGSDDPFAHFTPLTLTANLQAVPEPATFALLSIGVIGVAMLRGRRQTVFRA